WDSYHFFNWLNQGSQRSKNGYPIFARGYHETRHPALAFRGGVKRTSELMYQETRGALKVFLSQLINDAVACTDHRP
ncbi:hypothetical protein B0H19DRAFT_100212, partial [Mycena capillaripes]